MSHFSCTGIAFCTNVKGIVGYTKSTKTFVKEQTKQSKNAPRKISINIAKVASSKFLKNTLKMVGKHQKKNCVDAIYRSKIRVWLVD